MPGYKKLIAACLLLVLCTVLAACGKTSEPEPTSEPTTVTMPDGTIVDKAAESLDLSSYTDEDIPAILSLLSEFSGLKTIDVGSDDNISADNFIAITDAVPDAAYTYSFKLLGHKISTADKEIDIKGIDSAEAQTLAAILPYMPKLENVSVGDENTSPIDWDVFATITAAAPDVEYDYSFTLYGEKFNTSDEEIDLRKIPVDDGCAAIRKVLPCMTKCTYVDMDNCMEATDENNEIMAKLRDDFPDKGIVWRVYFSWNYSCRTDVETILCSLTADLYGDWGLTDEESVKPLSYCNKVKYLDIGHNNKLETISFVANMPDLEILIIYHSAVTDLSPLENCKKLRYLEIGMCPVESLEPLSGLTELTDLQMGKTTTITDIRPLYHLDKLERLWIGTMPRVSDEQIAEFCVLHPDCEVNTTDDEVDYTWRYKSLAPNEYWPQYAEIRSIFNYGENAQGQNFSGFDPYYNNSHSETPDPVESARYR